MLDQREPLDSQPAAAQKQDSATNVIQRIQKSHLRGSSLISNLLETIILPEFSVPVETPLSEIINLLATK